MSKPNLPPEPPLAPEPIVRPKKGKDASMKPVAAPPSIIIGHTWKDHVYLGSRRALKTLINVGGVTLAGAGVAIMKGVPPPLALLGAAGVTVGSALTMGTEKTLKEASKSGKVRWYESPELILAIAKAIPVVLQIIGNAIKALAKRKDDSNG